MNNTTITLIRPLFLGKIKPFQNLSLIISSVILLTAFILSWFDNHILSIMVGILLPLSAVSIVIFILLSLAFLWKRIEVVTIINGNISIEINKKLTNFKINNLSFLLNINSKTWKSEELLTPEIIDNVSTWGNYIIIPSENLSHDIYVQFIPDKDFFKVLPQLNVEIRKNRSILMNDTTDLLKKFLWMIWGAS